MDVRFYETEAGEKPAREYMRTRDADQRHLIGRKIRLIQDPKVTNIRQAGVDVKSVTDHEPLMELRIGYHRVFYVVLSVEKLPVMWLLHACQKDTEKAARGDIAVSERRMKELMTRLARR